MKTNFFIFLLFILKSSKSAEKFEIIYPKDKVLLGAGHFDFKWSSISNAKNYQLYINDILEATTSSTTYDYYTTKVQKFTAYIEAELANGEKQKTKKITFYITKKGLAVNDNMGKNLNPLTMNMGWYYTWSPTSPFAYKDTNYKYIEYVPMIWGIDQWEDNNLETVQNGDFMYLLGYNEPDLGDQSNIEYQTAAEHWPKFKGKSRYLGSPVPAFSPTWDNGQWLNNFMAAIDTKSVDFISLHLYYNNWAGEEAANRFLTDVVDGTYKKFNKPIWITEFAVSGWGYNNEEKRKEVDVFMRKSIDGLNEREYVERYAWFSFNTNNENDGASALWTESTGVLTDLGETYVSYGNPEGYDYRLNPGPEIEITSFVRDEVVYPDSIVVGDKEYVNLLRKNGVTVSASASVDGSKPQFAIDNDIKTRWETPWSDPQYLTVDLGNSYYIKQIEAMWQYASASFYSIEISDDGKSFTTVAKANSLALVERRSECFRFNKMIHCRYIRINCQKRTTEWGYSIWELAVYGSEESDTNPDDTEKPDDSTNQVKPDDPEKPDDSIVDSKETGKSEIISEPGNSDENSNDNDKSDNQGDENNPDDSSGKDKPKLSSGAIAAIVIVVIIVVAAAIIVPIIVIKRRNMNLKHDSDAEIMSTGNF